MNELKHPVGFWKRFAAAILDGIFVSIIAGMIGLLLGYNLKTIIGTNDIDAPWSSFDTVSSGIELLYMIVLPVVWIGYTLGKKALGIRIVKIDGSNVTFGTMIMRNVVAGLVYVLTLGIAGIVSFIMILSREDKRTLHDLIAGTYVTQEEKEKHS